MLGIGKWFRGEKGESKADSPENFKFPEEKGEAQEGSATEAAAEAPKKEVTLTAEEQQIQDGRTHNPDDAYAEAHLANTRYGEGFKGMELKANLEEKFGDQTRANMDRANAEQTQEHLIDQEKQKVNSILLEAASKNVTIHPYDASPLVGDRFIHEYLEDQRSHIGDLDPKKDGNFNLNDMEHLADQLGVKVQSLVEGNGKQEKMEYPVVLLQESQDTKTFITNGTGIIGDNKPRIFKITNQAFENGGYKLENKTDFKSIYPEANAEPAEQAEQSAAE